MEDVQVSNSSSEIQPSDAQLDVGKYVARFIFFAIILVVGVPGNSLILRVYWSKTLKTSTHILIMSMALTDLLTCLFQVFDIASDVVILSGRPESHLFDILGLFELTCLITSIGITIMIALDRYDCVCRPQRRFFNATRGKEATFISFLVAVCIMTPEYITVLVISTPILEILVMGFQLFMLLFSFMVIILCYYKVYMAIRKHVKIGLPSNMATLNVDVPRVDQPQQNPVAHKAPIKLEPALLTVPNKSSLQTISVASTSRSETNETVSEGSTENHAHSITSQMGTGGSEVPHQVHHHRGRHERSTGGPFLQRKTTRMLLITSVVLMLTWTPYCVFICTLIALRNGLSVNPVLIQILRQVYLMLYVNNFCNPIIYGLANRRFRKDCLALLRNIHIC